MFATNKLKNKIEINNLIGSFYIVLLIVVENVCTLSSHIYEPLSDVLADEIKYVMHAALNYYLQY